MPSRVARKSFNLPLSKSERAAIDAAAAAESERLGVPVRAAAWIRKVVMEAAKAAEDHGKGGPR